jgi:iron(III) transport system permease protein
VLPWSRFLEWAWNSVRLGGITAGLAVAVALALAFAVRRGPTCSRAAWCGWPAGLCRTGRRDRGGLLLPVGWLQAHFPHWGVGALVTTTAVGIVWAYLVRFCAVALQSVQSGYARIPASLDDSARMLGAGRGLMANVHWPLLRRSTAAAALLVFVDVMKELPATMVLRPFNSDTLAVVAYQLARDERLGEAALPSLALVAVGLVPVILLSRTLRDRHRGRSSQHRRQPENRQVKPRLGGRFPRRTCRARLVPRLAAPLKPSVAAGWAQSGF